MNQPNRSADNLRTAWFVPVDGDGHYIGTDVAERPPTFENLQTVVQAAVVFFSFLFVGLNLLVDIVYTMLDPRIRLN